MPFRARLQTPKRASPRPPVPRHDGFSPAQQRRFLTTLAATASVTQAASVAGISRTTAYNHRHDPRARDFRAAWEQAVAHAMGALVDLAMERAVDGVEEPVFQRGEQVGTRIRYDHRLLRFLVTKRESFAPAPVTVHLDGSETTHPVHTPAGFARHLDRIDPPPPRGPETLSTSSTSSEPASVDHGLSASPDARTPPCPPAPGPSP